MQFLQVIFLQAGFGALKQLRLWISAAPPEILTLKLSFQSVQVYIHVLVGLQVVHSIGMLLKLTLL